MNCTFHTNDGINHVCMVCGKPLRTHFVHAPARIVRMCTGRPSNPVSVASKGPASTLHNSIKAAVMAEVRRRWQDHPSLRTMEEIATLLDRYPPKCGKPGRVERYASYLLARYAWLMPDWGMEPDPAFWTPREELTERPPKEVGLP
jgi:hypothetical protein